MRYLIQALIASTTILFAVAAFAQTTTRDSGDAAHLYGYFAKPGMQAQFDQGYRTHLRWHQAKRDPLVWYGWYVAHGDRIGMFIDGSFGAPFAAFDQRVDPAGDGADAVKHFSPYAEPAFRASYRLRRELSTGFPLEQWKPSKSVQVFHYTLHAGTAARFEKALRGAREVLSRQSGTPAYTWYELVVGGQSPGYLLMIARDGWKSYDGDGDGLDTLVAQARDGRALLDDLAASVAEVKVETWDYSEKMSLIPEG